MSAGHGNPPVRKEHTVSRKTEVRTNRQTEDVRKRLSHSNEARGRLEAQKNKQGILATDITHGRAPERLPHSNEPQELLEAQKDKQDLYKGVAGTNEPNSSNSVQHSDKHLSQRQNERTQVQTPIRNYHFRSEPLERRDVGDRSDKINSRRNSAEAALHASSLRKYAQGTLDRHQVATPGEVLPQNSPTVSLRRQPTLLNYSQQLKGGGSTGNKLKKKQAALLRKSDGISGDADDRHNDDNIEMYEESKTRKPTTHFPRTSPAVISVREKDRLMNHDARRTKKRKKRSSEAAKFGALEEKRRIRNLREFAADCWNKRVD